MADADLKTQIACSVEFLRLQGRGNTDLHANANSYTALNRDQAYQIAKIRLDNERRATPEIPRDEAEIGCIEGYVIAERWD
jgi:hypothetical protein